MFFRSHFGLALLLTLFVVLPDRAEAQAAQGQASIEGRLVAAAIERTRHVVAYDGAYRRIAYPGGDVAADRGVCSDVVIRAYRAGLGVDLQQRVHEDMERAFRRYPAIWGLARPDRNIDHRRVPNLEVFFARHGQSLPVSRDPGNYRPGDLVTWRLGGVLPHIGIVTDRRTADGRRPLIAHNIGRGPRLEDILFDLPIHGHFRYLPEA
ncbi:MAG: DUF1287 domain-containing protein [Paracoccaceae bacterium]|nr:DUF1287 domain-containing protein [Paracoccaceae bacterium]